VKFKFTHHSQYRIEKRGISVLDIKSIIQNPDYSRMEQNGIIVCLKSVGEKDKITVIYKKVNNQYLIITAYYEK
jgi:hypothetical protein